MSEEEENNKKRKLGLYINGIPIEKYQESDIDQKFQMFLKCQKEFEQKIFEKKFIINCRGTCKIELTKVMVEKIPLLKDLW